MSEAIARMLGGGQKRKAVATVPQTTPMEEDQVENSAGGFVWAVSDESRLRRFLCLGTEGGSYYASEAALTVDNAKAVVTMLESGAGARLVAIVKEMSLAGRCAKQNPTLFALAIAARYPSEVLPEAERRQVAAAAYAALPEIARIPTHLFTFVDYCEKLATGSSGWGRAHRSAVATWYLAKAPKDLAFTVTKYPSRGGWAHRDLLRLAHPKPKKARLAPELSEEEKARLIVEYDQLFAFIAHGHEGLNKKTGEAAGGAVDDSGALALLDAVETLKSLADLPAEAAALVTQHRLAREHLPTQLLNAKAIWAALFPAMPMTAAIRNLPKMTNVGLFESRSDELKEMVRRLGSEEQLHKARIHPYAVLLAHETYKAGKGDKGKQTWTPVPALVAALDSAFYMAFKNVPSTGKRYLVALDVSGSMCSPIMGSALSARVASAAMSLIHARTEEGGVDFVSFHDSLSPLKIRKEMSLGAVVDAVSGLPFGATDCALPMEWARKKRRDYDVFVVYTDNETYFGKVHPAEALRKYRRERVRDARLIVVGMTATKFSIADPLDPGMLDVAGFDAAAPEVMRNFVLGHI